MSQDMRSPLPQRATKRCPFCAEEILDDAVKCRYCGSWLSGSVATRSWTRARQGKMIAGVCMGLAREFDVPVTIIRLAFVLGALIGTGIGFVLYVILWVVMPYDDLGE